MKIKVETEMSFREKILCMILCLPCLNKLQLCHQVLSYSLPSLGLQWRQLSAAQSCRRLYSKLVELKNRLHRLYPTSLDLSHHLPCRSQQRLRRHSTSTGKTQEHQFETNALLSQIWPPWLRQSFTTVRTVHEYDVSAHARTDPAFQTNIKENNRVC